MLKKAMIYLGLGPDEHYEEYDDEAPRSQGAGASSAVRYGENRNHVHGTHLSAVSGVVDASDPSLGRTVQPIPIRPVHGPDGENGMQVGSPQLLRSQSRAVGGQITRKPHAVSPEDFHDAKEIGDRFKSGQAVIVNLQAVDRDLRRRLVDFSSGLCYGRDGKMDRVADQVYLLTPVEVDASGFKTH